MIEVRKSISSISLEGIRRYVKGVFAEARGFIPESFCWYIAQYVMYCH